MEEKILNGIQHIRSKCKKRVTYQRIYSFINKGALFLDSDLFQDFMVGLKIDGYISKRGKEKSASYFARKKFIDSSSNEENQNSNNEISMQQNVPFFPIKRLRTHAKILKRRILSQKTFRKTLHFQIFMTLHNFVTTKGKSRMLV